MPIAGIGQGLGLGGGTSATTSGSSGGGGVSEPELTADDATDIAATTVTLSADITDTGGEDPVITVFWGEDDGGTDPDEWEDLFGLGAQGVGTVTKELAGQDSGAVYNFRFRAVNSAGTVWTAPAKTFLTVFGTVAIDTEANILALTGRAAGSTAYGTDTYDYYVYDGVNWQIYNND